MSKPKSLHILLIEDNVDLAKNIATFFEMKGHHLDFAHNGKQGLQLALDNVFDVVVLDLMLPGIDGLQVCQQLRAKANQHIPIIMLTARDTLADKVTGFEFGADDYLTKPFALEELYMRCLALSKRQTIHQSFVMELGDLKIDTQQQQVWRQQQKLELGSMGYRILKCLVDAHPRVLTRAELMQKLWGDEPTESDALRSHIYQLRQVVDKPFATPIIKTLHGVGFSLNIP